MIRSNESNCSEFFSHALGTLTSLSSDYWKLPIKNVHYDSWNVEQGFALGLRMHKMHLLTIYLHVYLDGGLIHLA